MIPVTEYTLLLEDLKRYQAANPNQSAKLVGLVFCRPELPLAKDHILPALGYFHRRSNKHLFFYFAGFSRGEAESGEGVAQLQIDARRWSFSVDAFDELRSDVEKHYTQWKYSGECDLILAICHFFPVGDPIIDIDTAVPVDLSQTIRSGRVESVGRLFEAMSRSAEGEVPQRLADRPSNLKLWLDRMMQPARRDYLESRPPAPAHQPTPTPVGGVQNPSSSPYRGPFFYDDVDTAIVVEDGRKFQLPVWAVKIFRAMIEPDSHRKKIRTSAVSKDFVATCFKFEQLRKRDESRSDSELRRMAGHKMKEDPSLQDLLTREFMRQFSRWARKNGFDPKSIITTVYNRNQVTLGVGWNLKKPITVKDSEVGIILGAEPQNESLRDRRDYKLGHYTEPQYGLEDEPD